MVTKSQHEKCGLKYVIEAFTRQVTILDDRSTLYKVAAASVLGCGNECSFYDHQVMTDLAVYGRIGKAKKQPSPSIYFIQRNEFRVFSIRMPNLL
jgi:hypothetical protein